MTRTQPTTSKARQRAIKALLITGGALAALIGLGWAGLQVQPAPFPSVAQPPAPPATIPLPTGLPAPVERFYCQIYGERVPVITSGVISGRGTRRPCGPIAFPMRFRLLHAAERTFRAYFKLTLFGLPMMNVNEHYVDGTVRQELPFGVEEGEPKLDHSATVRMYAEWVTWLPALLLTDPQVRCEPGSQRSSGMRRSSAMSCSTMPARRSTRRA